MSIAGRAEPDLPDLALGDLRAFVAVAEGGTFTAAAGALRVSQPAVSRAVARVETALGVAVFDRSTHHVALTDAGRTLLPHARTTLHAAESAVRLTRRSAGRPTLLVAVYADCDAGLLPPVLARYGADASLPSVELWFAEKHELADAVRSGRADLALATGPLTDEGLEVEQVWDEERVAVLPAGHVLARRRRLGLDDVLAGPVVTWPTLPDATDRYFRGCDTVPPRDPPDGPAAGTLAEALRLVELGRAVTFLPVSIADRFRRPELVTRPVDGLSRSRGVLAWRAGSRDRSVAAFVRATFAEVDARAAADAVAG